MQRVDAEKYLSFFDLRWFWVERLAATLIRSLNSCIACSKILTRQCGQNWDKFLLWEIHRPIGKFAGRGSLDRTHKNFDRSEGRDRKDVSGDESFEGALTNKSIATSDQLPPQNFYIWQNVHNTQKNISPRPGIQTSSTDCWRGTSWLGDLLNGGPVEWGTSWMGDQFNGGPV